MQVRIRQLQQGLEGLALLSARAGPPFLQESLKQYIKFLTAAPATPAQAGGNRLRLRLRHRCQCWRSTSSFLISAIARAGLRSFGHASVQFMIVWQRYSRNGSSSASSRSPAASSRESMIQR